MVCGVAAPCSDALNEEPWQGTEQAAGQTCPPSLR
jgi:hypothetical protein